MKLDKLYSGISYLNNINGRDNVAVKWYYGDWKLHWTDIDYSKIIQDYSFMTDDEKSMSRYYANQLFTQDEIELLKDFLLSKHGTGVFVLEQPLPIETYFVDDNTGDRQFYQDHYRFEHNGNTIHLDVAEDYELHFPVSGNYYPGNGLPSDELSEECLEDGVTFIRDVLKSLKYKARWSDRKLTSILKNLYDKDGFYVAYRSPVTTAGRCMEI